MRAGLGQLLSALYPPQCAGCQQTTDTPHGLCPACWSEARFVSGTICDCCGAPVQVAASGQTVICDGCLQHPPAWDRGRAAMLYEGTGRRIVLALKHGDRLDLVRPLAAWMASAGAEMIAGAEVIAPVPLHWTRLARRRFNQSAELARQRPLRGDARLIPDLLIRQRRTQAQEGMSRDTRFQTQAGAFAVRPRHIPAIAGRTVLLIDDVMTSGATLSACAETLRAAGAETVNVLVAARVAREGFYHI